MKTAKRTDEHTIFRRGDGRYAVRGADRRWINGDRKAEILAAEGLISPPPQAKPEPEPEAEREAGEAGAGSGESEANE